MKTDDTVTRRRARALDRALAGENGHRDPDGLLATAAELRAAFDFELPTPSHERAMFVSGVGTRHHRMNPLRLLVPVVAFLALVVLTYLGGRTALPGDTLYPVRKALGSVGLAASPTEEIDTRIGEATSLLSRAERSLVESPGTSLRLAVQALEELGPAIELLDELTGNELTTREGAIEGLESRAVDVIGLVAQPGNDRGDDGNGGNRGSSSSGSGDDRSGSNSGSGDRDTDDNSGPGDGDDDDNSGPGGGGDDSTRGSSSGPGSGDDVDDDRSGSNSGPGSGDDDDDNSGPGSGDDDLPDVDGGRNGSDNSGPGSGDDDRDDDDDDNIDLDDLDDDERDDLLS